MNASEALLCKLQVAQQAQAQQPLSAGPPLRQLVLLACNPLLLEPQYHKKVRCTTACTPRLPTPPARLRACALARLPPRLLQPDTPRAPACAPSTTPFSPPTVP